MTVATAMKKLDPPLVFGNPEQIQSVQFLSRVEAYVEKLKGMGILEICEECNGSGRTTCIGCDGLGEIECKECYGTKYPELAEGREFPDSDAMAEAQRLLKKKKRHDEANL